MLAAENRLRKSSEITRVYKRGTYGAGSGMLSVKAASSGRSVARAVIVVGKKVDKRAVVRNRLRRRISAVLREMWGTVKPGYDIVISVHSDIRAVPTDELRQLLTVALERAKATN